MDFTESPSSVYRGNCVEVIVTEVVATPRWSAALSQHFLTVDGVGFSVENYFIRYSLISNRIDSLNGSSSPAPS